MNTNTMYARDVRYAESLLVNASDETKAVLDIIEESGSLQDFMAYFGDFWKAVNPYGDEIFGAPDKWIVTNQKAIFEAFVDNAK